MIGIYPKEEGTNLMAKKLGSWIDRNKAVIVSIANNIEEKRIITSDTVAL